MTTGRNHPCTCGSGKKYKYCCLHQPMEAIENDRPTQSVKPSTNTPFAVMSATQTNDTISVPSPLPKFLAANETWHDDFTNDEDDETWEDEHDEDLFTRSGILDALYHLHVFTLKDLPHIKAYKKMRKIHSDIQTSMAQHVDAGKFEHKFEAITHTETAETMTQQRKSNKSPVITFLRDYDLDTQEGMQAYYDMYIYKMAKNANSITEEYLQKGRYRKPEKIAMLEAMHNSVIGLYEIISVDSSQGYVRLQNVFTNQVHKIIDIAMSMDDTHMEMYNYRRIITIDDISFGTGLSLSFKKMDKFITDFIKRHKKDYHPHKETIIFNELYNQFTTAPGEVEVKHISIK